MTTEAIEVEIPKALLVKLAEFGVAQNLSVSYPNKPFVPPTHGPAVRWLRANILPADTVTLGIGHNATNQHYGLLQIDAMHGSGLGELGPARLAALIISAFARGTRLSSGDFNITINKSPYRAAMLKDDPWVFVSVRIPYIAFAIPASAG